MGAQVLPRTIHEITRAWNLGGQVAVEGAPAGTGGVLPGDLCEALWSGWRTCGWVGDCSAPHDVTGVVDTWVNIPGALGLVTS